VASIEPVYLDFMLGDSSHRQVIPFSRHVEYADKLITRSKIANPNPPPLSAADHRCKGLRNAGAEEAGKIVASEKMDWLAEQILSGRHVFVSTAALDQADTPLLIELQKKFGFVPVADYLYKLRPVTPNTGN